jgi:integrase
MIKKYLDSINSDPLAVTRNDLRNYLLSVKESVAASTYKNVLSSLKRFYRDFLDCPQVVESFKFPQIPFKPIQVPTKKELQKFYYTLDSVRSRAVFLFYARSGLRSSEVLRLDRFKNIDFKKRMITPQKEGNLSKHTWVSFYNREAEQLLNSYLKTNKKPRLFPICKRHMLRIFSSASESSGVKVTPQILREWFCCEMGALGVPDRFVDAFCGRTPKSVLARHYTDYNPERLRVIYEGANIQVLA